MRHALKLHPGSRCDAVTGIEVDVTRPRPSQLTLRYLVSGRIGDLVLPPVMGTARAGDLWRHTCFEAFLRARPHAAYCEFNFAPSTEWAAYRFDDHRSGTREAAVDDPRIGTIANPSFYELQVVMALDRLTELPPDSSWLLGLSVVIEETNGRLSYWALAHPPGKPDFHHPDCFALELPPA